MTVSKLAKLESAMETTGVLPLVEHSLVGAFASKSFGKRDAESLGLKVAEAIISHLAEHVANRPQGSGT